VSVGNSPVRRLRENVVRSTIRRRARGRGTSAAGSVRVVLIANIAFPYRVRLYEELAQTSDLQVFLLGRTEPGRHWTNSGLPDFIRWLPAIQYVRGRYVFYSLRPVKAMRILKRASPDVVFLPSWHYPASWRILLWATLSGIPTISWYESTDRTHGLRNRLVAAARTLYFVMSDLIISTGSETTRTLIGMGVPEEMIITGYNAVDSEFFHKAAFAAREAITPASGHGYLFVGQLIPRKNPDLLLEAFSDVRGPGDRLAFAGLGEMQSELEMRAEELGLGESVSFLGHVQQDGLPALYAQFQTLVLPSSEEVWGLVVNEALASGLHAIVSDTCGVASDVRHQRGVHVCSPSVTSIAHAMSVSAEQWSGPIEDPEVLAMSTKHLAQLSSDTAVQALAKPRRFWARLRQAKAAIRVR
jgi:glycosyltransferase involved in cell wall biosynthesis